MGRHGRKPGTDKVLETLKTRTRLELSLDDIRIMVGCMKAVAYQSEIDDEPYLDSDALALKERLESLYRDLLLRAEKDKAGGKGEGLQLHRILKVSPQHSTCSDGGKQSTGLTSAVNACRAPARTST